MSVQFCRDQYFTHKHASLLSSQPSKLSFSSESHWWSSDARTKQDTLAMLRSKIFTLVRLNNYPRSNSVAKSQAKPLNLLMLTHWNIVDCQWATRWLLLQVLWRSHLASAVLRDEADSSLCLLRSRSSRKIRRNWRIIHNVFTTSRFKPTFWLTRFSSSDDKLASTFRELIAEGKKKSADRARQVVNSKNLKTWRWINGENQTGMLELSVLKPIRTSFLILERETWWRW